MPASPLLPLLAIALALKPVARPAERLHTRGGEVQADRPRGSGWSCNTASDWRSYYRPVLQTASRLEARIVTSEGRRRCAVDAEGTSAAGESLRLSESYSVVPGHVLLVSAAGPAELLTGQEAAIAEWFEGVRFGAVRD